MLTNRAARQRPRSRFSRKTQTLLGLAAALAAYGLLIWALAHAG